MSKSARVWLGIAVAICAGIVAAKWGSGDDSPASLRSAVVGEKGESASRIEPPHAPRTTPAAAAAQASDDPDADTPAASPVAGSRPPGAPAGAARAAADLPPDSQKAQRVLGDLQFVLRDYRTAVGGNPVGTNAEITGSLLGDNARQTKVVLPDGVTVNGRGEMCDPWGTPYFFHQLSATRMEIRSAGPDRRMWTEDDVAM